MRTLIHTRDALRAALAAAKREAPADALAALPEGAQTPTGTLRSFAWGDPEAADPAARCASFDVVIATETPVRERAFDWESFCVVEFDAILRAAGCDMSRLEGGAFLVQHNGHALSTLGVLENVRVEGTEIIGRVRASLREEFQGVLRDIEAGILRQTSVGYDPKTQVWTERADGVSLCEVTEWQGLECSLVGIAADPNTTTRAAPVLPAVTPAPTNTPTTITPAQVRTGHKPMKPSDVIEFQRRCERLGISNERANALIVEAGDAPTMNDLVERAFTEAAASKPPVPSPVGGGDDTAAVEFARAAALAIASRAQPENTRLRERLTKMGGAALNMRGMSMLGIARAAVERDGLRAPTDDFELAKLALGSYTGAAGARYGELARQRASVGMSSANLPSIFLDATNIMVMDGYEMYAPTYRQIAGRADFKDFREHNFVSLSSLQTLRKVGENGEIKRGVVRDRKTGMTCSRYGLIYQIPFEAIVNDTLDVLAEIPSEFVDIATETESDIAWAPLLNNEVYADDGVDFFHADHANIGATTERPNGDTMAEHQRLMLAQRAKGARAGEQGRRVRLAPRFMVTGTKLFGDAQKALDNGLFAASLANVVPQALRDIYAPPICEPRFDDVESGLMWLSVADPSRRCPPIKYGFLRGIEAPQLTSREGFEVSGLEIKCEHTFGAGLYDYRGAVVTIAAE